LGGQGSRSNRIIGQTYMSSAQTYLGTCHCGAIRFRLTAEPITRGLRCNCSLCARRGAVMSARYFDAGEVQVAGAEALTRYRWGDRLVDHWFCRSCGVYTFHNQRATPADQRPQLCGQREHDVEVAQKHAPKSGGQEVPWHHGPSVGGRSASGHDGP
jgi:hypothetical protein